MRYIPVLMALIFFSCGQEVKKDKKDKEAKKEFVQMKKLNFSPKSYVVYKTSKPLKIDGSADEEAWKKAPFTSKFEDIEGDVKPKPRFDTRAKMLWDDKYLYVYAELEEPHIWANLTKRDAVIFYDNDFEVFIDPDGNTHGYYEYEVNAFNTVWDLMLIKPYRDGGPPINNWDINGLKSAVKVYGTINKPEDKDDKWTVEIAFPFSALNEFNQGPRPADGVQWRINFSRVEWDTEVVDGKYVKVKDPKTGKPLPEYNWVWSPQGVINMHQPETWGFIQFADVQPGTKEVKFVYDTDEDLKWELMNVYYAEKAFRSSTGRYTPKLKLLKKVGLDVKSLKHVYSIQTTKSLFEARARKKDSKFVWHIDDKSYMWKTKKYKIKK
jgi:hypothetical protein